MVASYTDGAKSLLKKTLCTSDTGLKGPLNASSLKTSSYSSGRLHASFLRREAISYDIINHSNDQHGITTLRVAVVVHVP